MPRKVRKKKPASGKSAGGGLNSARNFDPGAKNQC